MTPPSDAPICFLDTETDGIHPGRKPWEIAMVRREPDGTESATAFFVEIDLSTADPFGLKVGRFHDRHPLGQWVSQHRDAPMTRPWAMSPIRTMMSRADAAEQVARFTHGAHIVGAVPNFDTETLDPLLRAHGLLPGWHHHLTCIEVLAVGFLAGQGTPIRPPWKSDDLTEKLGLEPTPAEERHTAMGDVRWAMRVYDAVMGGGDRK